MEADAVPDADACAVSDALLSWFHSRERDIPWRDEVDPYRIWVAEVMAQQTRVETMRDRYRRFTDRFPSVESLARADVDDVLKEWEGLGYYARARNLHAGARTVVGRHGGRLPRSRSELLDLPGVGPYTAGAIGSLAFGADEPAVDGNARRVLSRLFDLDQPTASRLDRAARRLIDARPGEAGALNQALMDLGSEICVPRSPECERCPVADACLALARGTVELRPPPRAGSRPMPRKWRAVGLVWRGGLLLVARRPEPGLLGGMWDFPGTDPQFAERALPDRDPAPDVDVSTRLTRDLRARWNLEVEIRDDQQRAVHVFSHFRLETIACPGVWLGGDARPPAGWAALWIAPEDLQSLAFPRAAHPIVRMALGDGCATGD